MTFPQQSGMRKRDGTREIFARFQEGAIRIREVGEGEKKRKTLTMLASTSRAIDWGGYREVLVHDENSVDHKAARALLLNHNPNRIIGTLTAFRMTADGLEIDAELLPDARMDSGVSVADAIESGALRGVSVGYHYSRSDYDYDEESNTVTVRKWRLLELSATPIPADDAAGMRSRSLPSEHKLAEQPAKESAMAEDTKKTEDQVAASEAQRAADIKRDREIAIRAESHGLKASDYLGMTDEKANEAMLRDLAERNKVKPAGSSVVTITEDDADKQRDAIHLAMSHRAGQKADVAANPYAGRSITEIARKYARQIGIRGSEDWTKHDLAHFILGRTNQIQGFRGAANISMASFPGFVMLNAITKIVAKGFEAAPRALVGQSGTPIYSTKTAPDFKSFYIGGLGTANLQEVAENAAAPELDKTEGAYNDTLKMWAGTLSLSYQALVSDDTSSFDASLRKAGPIAQKTRERRLVQKFLRGVATTDASTWTNNTTSGSTPVYTTADTIAAARANINKANAAMQVKIGLDGNPTGNMTRFLLAGPTSGLYLAGLLNQAPGQIVSNGFGGQYELVVSPWLESSLITGYSTTTYYHIADPAVVDALILTELAGMNGPQVMEYDAGSTLARNWKLFDAFEADLFWAANKAGTNVIFGAQQATT